MLFTKSGTALLAPLLLSVGIGAAPDTHRLARRHVEGLPAFPEDGQVYLGAVRSNLLDICHATTTTNR